MVTVAEATLAIKDAPSEATEDDRMGGGAAHSADRKRTAEEVKAQAQEAQARFRAKLARGSTEDNSEAVAGQ